MIDQNLGFLDFFERVRHGSSRLWPRLRVTLGTRRHFARLSLHCSGHGKSQTQKSSVPSHRGFERATSFRPRSLKNISPRPSSTRFCLGGPQLVRTSPVKSLRLSSRLAGLRFRRQLLDNLPLSLPVIGSFQPIVNKG